MGEAGRWVSLRFAPSEWTRGVKENFLYNASDIKHVVTKQFSSSLCF